MYIFKSGWRMEIFSNSRKILYLEVCYIARRFASNDTTPKSGKKLGFDRIIGGTVPCENRCCVFLVWAEFAWRLDHKDINNEPQPSILFGPGSFNRVLSQKEAELSAWHNGRGLKAVYRKIWVHTHLVPDRVYVSFFPVQKFWRKFSTVFEGNWWTTSNFGADVRVNIPRWCVIA